jgi:hypothetical protein
MQTVTLALAFLLAGNACVVEHELLDPSASPGSTDPAVTQENLAQTVCVPGNTKTVRPPTKYTNALKLIKLRVFGYEPANLWPQH